VCQKAGDAWVRAEMSRGEFAERGPATSAPRGTSLLTESVDRSQSLRLPTAAAHRAAPERESATRSNLTQTNHAGTFAKLNDTSSAAAPRTATLDRVSEGVT